MDPADKVFILLPEAKEQDEGKCPSLTTKRGLNHMDIVILNFYQFR
jgi:hypothetical protein